jgi:hypothetical protein
LNKHERQGGQCWREARSFVACPDFCISGGLDTLTLNGTAKEQLEQSRRFMRNIESQHEALLLRVDRDAKEASERSGETAKSKNYAHDIFVRPVLLPSTNFGVNTSESIENEFQGVNSALAHTFAFHSRTFYSQEYTLSSSFFSAPPSSSRSLASVPDTGNPKMAT